MVRIKDSYVLEFRLDGRGTFLHVKYFGDPEIERWYLPSGQPISKREAEEIWDRAENNQVNKASLDRTVRFFLGWTNTL
jgi:hypothetical protein